MKEHIASYYSPAPLPGHLTREEESRGKGFAHQSDSEEPAEEELQVPVLKKRIVVRKIRVSRIPNLPDAELAHVSAPPQPEPVASSDKTHPEATLVEKVGITEAEDELTQMLKTQEKLTDFAKVSIFIDVFQETLYLYLRPEEHQSLYCRPSDLNYLCSAEFFVFSKRSRSVVPSSSKGGNS